MGVICMFDTIMVEEYPDQEAVPEEDVCHSDNTVTCERNESEGDDDTTKTSSNHSTTLVEEYLDEERREETCWSETQCCNNTAGCS